MRGEKGINDKKQNKKAQQQKAISKPPFNYANGDGSCLKQEQ